MSGWIVYSKDGSIERCKLRSLEYGGTAMGERAVTATFDYHSEVAFEVFDYIEYRGERFELEAVPTVKKLSSFEYQYELRFVSLKYELERCEMRDLVPSDNGVVYPTPLTFSFTGDVRYLTDRIQACLDAMYGTDVWKIIIADGTSSEEKNITIAQQNCWNALALVNSTYGLNFYIKGRIITIGGEQPLVSHTFEYGKGNGLYEIERASDTETGIVTKLRAYGSTRNIDYSYPKKPEWSDSVLPVSFALSPLRLMLPSFKTDGKTDFVLADDAAIAKYGIREASMVYDDIYPSITGATYNGQTIDEIKAVDAVDESQKTFVVYLHELGFDLEEHLTTSDAQISMKSGALQGYTFTISSIEKQTGGYKITLGKNSLENSEEFGAYVPGVNWNMKAGDKFVLLNILMPQKYIRDAENRLLARAEEYLAKYSKTNFSYNIGMHEKFLIQNPSVYDSLIEGSKLKVYDKEIGIDEEVTIQSITITENLEDNILPQVKVTLNNEPSASTLDRIQGKLNEVAAETAANGFTTQSEIMAQYRRKLDKPFFDKLFVAIDANGNEIPSTDVITPIAYIKAKYHVASVGGFTMYAMDKDLDIPSLASGLPFDGRTIWYNPETQQIEVIGGTGGGSGEGVSNFWDLSGIPSWITNSKPKYTYSEIEGTPDLSGYATESWVLGKSYITSATLGTELAKYVTLDTDQPLKGKKDFKNGLSIDGLEIRKSQDDVVYIDANLVVRGGVTMYAQNEVDIPSIIDSIPTASTTVKGIASFDGAYFSVVNGKVSLIASNVGLNEEELYNYLTSNNYAKKSDIPSLSGYATESWVNTKLGGYLPLNGNASSATKLQTARTIWGQSFDGTGNVSGNLTLENNYEIVTKNTSGSISSTLYRTKSNNLSIGEGIAKESNDTYISGNNLFLRYGTGLTNGISLISSGNVGVGTTSPAYKLDVNGAISTSTELIVNGGKIKYDSTKKYWKLEGDLLVTGGVTMYGSDSSFTPSTIMDAIAVDGTTISKDGGVLKVIGGTGGGVADSVAWENITGKPTWIGSSKPTYSYSEITGAISNTELQNYLTSNSYLNVTSGDNRYLKLSGGEISSTSAYPLTINTSKQTIEFLLKCNYSIKAYIGWNVTEGVFLQEGESLAYIGVQPNKNPYYFNGTRYTLWHEGNFTPSNYLPLSGGTLTGNLTITTNGWGSQLSILETSSNDSVVRFYSNSKDGFLGALGFTPNKNPIVNIGGIGSFTIWHEGNDGSGSGLDADTLDGLHNGELKASTLHSGGGFVIDANTIQFSDFSLRFYSGIPNTSTNLPTSSGYQNGLLVLPLHSNGSTAQIYLCVGKNPYFRSHQTLEWNEIAYKTDNVSSATKLQTARTLWGQSFDGTGNIDGRFKQSLTTSSGNVESFIIETNDIDTNWGITNFKVKTTASSAESDSYYTTLLSLNAKTLNIGIGTTSPSYTLDVSGACRASISVTSNMFFTNGEYGIWKGSSFTGGLSANDLAYYAEKNIFYGNVGIGTITPSSKLEINGNSGWTTLVKSSASEVALAHNGGYGVAINTKNINNGTYVLAIKYGQTTLGSGGNDAMTVMDNGNVGIGTATPTTNFDINGKSMEVGASVYGSGGVGSEIYMSTHRERSTLCARGMRMYVSGSATGVFQSFSIDAKNYGTLSNIMSINSSGNLLVTGGVTMYSDQRKKTILNHVELSLKDIANAPLIEHYYNSDDKKTTHVGSIAQYWASMNDWFCKLDSEGFYTMEIQNAALASAISIARELDRYESKTDKTIKTLKKRICELEEEVERLRAS